MPSVPVKQNHFKTAKNLIIIALATVVAPFPTWQRAAMARPKPPVTHQQRKTFAKVPEIPPLEPTVTLILNSACFLFCRVDVLTR